MACQEERDPDVGGIDTKAAIYQCMKKIKLHFKPHNQPLLYLPRNFIGRIQFFNNIFLLF
jgi:hypothetical protein